MAKTKKTSKAPRSKAPDENANAFKHGLGPGAVDRIAKNISAIAHDFPKRAFLRDAKKGLEQLELKARVMHLIGALKKHLPEDPSEAIAILVRAGEVWDKDPKGTATGGFAAWPLIDFVGEWGLSCFDHSMRALRCLTPLFTAEFAVRPFIDHDQQRALHFLTRFADDADPRVRRLASEGTRPRLPWGRRLVAFQRDPSAVLALLELLKDDPSEAVRRSVANNINDISKDHPEQAVATCRRWKKGASAARAAMIRHGLRTLVKRGDAEALAVLGYDPKAKLQVREFALAQKNVALGESLEFSFSLRSMAKKAQPLVVDFAVHHVKKSGERTAKVFKLKTFELLPGQSVTISKAHPFKAITTRVYYAGRHGLELLINGRRRAMVDFDLTL